MYSKSRNPNCNRIIFAHNTKIKSEKLGHTNSHGPMESSRQMVFRIITILWLLPLSWSIGLERELTLNPSREIIFSYWMFLVQKLSICLLPLSILYLCRRKMIQDKKKWTSPHQIYFSWIAVTRLTKILFLRGNITLFIE